MTEEKSNAVTKGLQNLLLGALFGIIMTMTFFTSRDAMAKAQATETRVAVIESQYSQVEKKLCEVAADVKSLLRANGVRQ